jgi:hypothetical protein
MPNNIIMADAAKGVISGKVTTEEIGNEIPIPALVGVTFNRLLVKVSGNLSNGLKGTKVTLVVFIDTTNQQNCFSIGTNTAGTAISSATSTSATIVFTNGTLMHTAGTLKFAATTYEYYAWEE